MLEEARLPSGTGAFPCPIRAMLSQLSRRPLGADAGPNSGIEHSGKEHDVTVSGQDPIIAGVAGRYATALFELARDSNKLKQVEKDLAALQSMLEKSAELQRLVRSPVFSAEDQTRALLAVLSKAKIKGLTVNFLSLIARNRRLFGLADMIAAFRTLCAQHRGEIIADVATATKLSAAQVKRLKTSLKSALGQDVAVEARIDPELLGGLVVKVGSRMIDNSLKTKLDNLKIAMKEVG